MPAADLIYLPGGYFGKSITDEQGKTYPMTRILDITTSIQHKKISPGYRIIRAGTLFNGLLII